MLQEKFGGLYDLVALSAQPAHAASPMASRPRSYAVRFLRSHVQSVVPVSTFTTKQKRHSSNMSRPHLYRVCVSRRSGVSWQRRASFVDRRACRLWRGRQETGRTSSPTINVASCLCGGVPPYCADCFRFGSTPQAQAEVFFKWSPADSRIRFF